MKLSRHISGALLLLLLLSGALAQTTDLYDNTDDSDALS
jgi:hypothetical protein